MPLKKLEFKTALDEEYLTIRYSPSENFIWSEWKGDIPSALLREAILFCCDFVLANKVELMLADYSRMSSPSMEDQVWISNHTAEMLRRSMLRKVANLMAQDLFQQIAIGNIYINSPEAYIPCSSRDFVSDEEAQQWLFSA